MNYFTYHADYSQRGAPIRISFFDNRIEIENPGILLPGMTIEDMLQGISKIRNHVIARVIYDVQPRGSLNFSRVDFIKTVYSL